MSNRTVYLILAELNERFDATLKTRWTYSARSDSPLFPNAMSSTELLDGLAHEDWMPKVQETCLAFSLDHTSLSQDVRLAEIPTPGVVIILKRGEAFDGEWNSSDPNHIVALMHLAPDLRNRRDPYTASYKDYLSSHHAQVQQVRRQRIDVFFSYAEADRETAQEIVDGLRNLGLEIFMAQGSIVPGDDWKDEIREAIRQASIVVVLFTPNSHQRSWVLAEAGIAWILEIPLIPACMFMDDLDLPEFINDSQAIDVTSVEGRKLLEVAVKQRLLR